MDIKGLLKKLPKLPKLPKLTKKFKKKKLIIIGASAIAFIASIIIILFFVMGSDDGEKNASNDSGIENIQLNKVDYENIIILKPFKWIALKDGSHMGKVSINIALELISKDKIEMVEIKRNNIRALVRNLAAEMKWIELRSPEGKIRFKYILIEKVNSLFPDIVIRNLYLTHFIMR